MKILDCTLRDGGYYTNWDFDKKMVENYLVSMNDLPIKYLEVGYRSIPLEGYAGEYFYLPLAAIKWIKEKSDKKLVIILNEKDIRDEHVDDLLRPCVPYITMVRLAIDPANFSRALDLAAAVKEIGFEVGFNVMYMSNWDQYPDMWNLLPRINGLVDYFYMVDSFGGIYPEDVRRTTEKLKGVTNVRLGFHGHNNLELALINTLTALDAGVEMVDATITGMGRGAGNLKTELLLTALNAKNGLEVNYNSLTKTVDDFRALQSQHEWGTNLPYMVSGANSLPQKQVMEWVSKRFYSYNSIIRALNNQSVGRRDNVELQSFRPGANFERVLIVGGGPTAQEHAQAINTFVSEKCNLAIVHASSKNAGAFLTLDKPQFYCLVGNEGHRLENVLGEEHFSGNCILPPYPRKMGTYVPEALKPNAYELEEVISSDRYLDSHTALALQVTRLLGAQEVFLVGYDGYTGAISKREKELFMENEYIFSFFIDKFGAELKSITPTEYTHLSKDSVYKWF